MNRYRLVGAASRRLGWLRRVASTEVVIATGVLLVAAALVNVSPPAEAAAQTGASPSQPANLVVSGSDFATTVKLSLTVTPGEAGFDVFSARVSDYTTGTPVDASSVTLQFTQPLRPQLGTSTLVLRRQSAGTYAARGGNLSLSGVWEVAAIIENGLSSTEVHLQLATITAPPKVTVSKFSGNLPTLYTVQLTQGRTVQVYIDPNRPGNDAFHVTFFDVKGNEFQVSQLAVGMTPPAATQTVLVVTRFDPIGHFIAQATIPAGSTRFDLVAALPDGEVLTTYLMITPGA